MHISEAFVFLGISGVDVEDEKIFFIVLRIEGNC